MRLGLLTSVRLLRSVHTALIFELRFATVREGNCAEQAEVLAYGGGLNSVGWHANLYLSCTNDEDILNFLLISPDLLCTNKSIR